MMQQFEANIQNVFAGSLVALARQILEYTKVCKYSILRKEKERNKMQYHLLRSVREIRMIT